MRRANIRGQVINDIDSEESMLYSGKSYNNKCHGIFKLNSRRQKTSVLLTLGIVGVIVSSLAIVMLIVHSQNDYRPVLLLECGVENFMDKPSHRPLHRDHTAKCRFINLNTDWYQRSSGNICGFDQRKDFIYANIPRSYQAKKNIHGHIDNSLATEIFRLPCRYSIYNYCPLDDSPRGGARTATITVYPTGHRTINSLQATPTPLWKCVKHPMRVISLWITLIIVFTISICMVIYDICTIYGGLYGKNHYNIAIQYDNASNIIVYTDEDYLAVP